MNFYQAVKGSFNSFRGKMLTQNPAEQFEKVICWGWFQYWIQNYFMLYYDIQNILMVFIRIKVRKEYKYANSAESPNMVWYLNCWP